MIFPSEVRGKYRIRRQWVGFLLGIFFLVLPWLSIGGHQAFLFDIPGRRFSIFGFLFWAHDVPLLLFVAGGFILAVALVTAVFGRVWCGWACPQTIFVDLVFRKIERVIEGDAVTLRRQANEPLNFERFLLKAGKWAAFTAVGSVISHSLLAYFIGTSRLMEMMASSPVDHPVPFFLMAGILGFILFNFGWLRERFCTQICPYGRFQTVLLDDKSWVVAYDARRGENRKGSPAGAPYGDCVACGKCVAVCPTGIDIRNGLQLECISCTACMDACDSVMKKIGKPEGLIRYDSQPSSGKPLVLSRSIFRPRPMLYLSIFLGLFFVFLWVLHRREAIDVVVIRAVGVPYEEIKSENRSSEVTNHFNIDFHNLTFEKWSVELLALDESNEVRVVSNELPSTLGSGERRRLSVFLRFPKTRLSEGKAVLKLRVRSRNYLTGKIAFHDEEVNLVGPY